MNKTIHIEDKRMLPIGTIEKGGHFRLPDERGEPNEVIKTIDFDIERYLFDRYGITGCAWWELKGIPRETVRGELNDMVKRAMR